MFSRPKILFLVSLLFVALLNPKFNPYLLFKFLIFYHSSQKTGLSDFDELRVTDSTLNEGTNSLINERKGAGLMVRRALSQHERHKTRNG